MEELGDVIRIFSSMLIITEVDIYNNIAGVVLACDSTIIVHDIQVHSVLDPQLTTCIQYDGFIETHSHLKVTTQSGETTTIFVELKLTTTLTSTDRGTVQIALPSTTGPMAEARSS